MRVTYIGHSGFSVELESHILLFDYYEGTMPEFDPAKKLLVFASHSHPDHFNREILKLADVYPDVEYIFPKDIRIAKKEQRESEHFMRKRDEITVGDTKVKSLRSTDEGVAFLVRCEDRIIYHAGDLNWWHWEEESTLYNETMKERYQSEIGKLKEALSGKTIDVAFLVLDPRQEDAYALGMEHFLLEIPVQFAVPMHLWEEYALARQYVETYGQTHEKTRFWCVSGKGEEVILPEEA